MRHQRSVGLAAQQSRVVLGDDQQPPVGQPAEPGRLAGYLRLDAQVASVVRDGEHLLEVEVGEEQPVVVPSRALREVQVLDDGPEFTCHLSDVTGRRVALAARLYGGAPLSTGEHHGVHAPRQLGTEGQPDRARLHELRRHLARLQRVGPRRRGGGADLPAGRRAGHQLLGHRQRLRLRQLRGDRRAGHREVQQSRGGRAGDEGVLPDARRSRRIRPVPPGDHGADRRVVVAGWGPTTSTSTRSTASTRRLRSRRRWKRCTTW